MYVGPEFDKTTGVKLIRANIVNAPFKISPGTGDQTTLTTEYDASKHS